MSILTGRDFNFSRSNQSMHGGIDGSGVRIGH
jgi:hypothetical protein